MEKIIIACACDNNYAGYCGIMLTSVFENNKTNHIEANILTDFIDEANSQKLYDLGQKYGQEVKIINVDKSYFENFPIGQRFKNYISLCTYYRLLIPSLFSCSKVLYLDCDIIVRTNISELWNEDIENYAFAAVKDMTFTINTSIPRLKYRFEDSYYNAGVCLFNVDFLRTFDFDNKVFRFMKDFADRIIYHDQDILNGICHGYFKDLSVKWNMMEPFLKKDPQCDPSNQEELKKYQCSPAIIHYTSSIKPWFVECKHIYIREFWYYAKLSPWKDIQPSMKFKSIKDRIRYELIQFLLKVRDFDKINRYRFVKVSLQPYSLK